MLPTATLSTTALRPEYRRLLSLSMQSAMARCSAGWRQGPARTSNTVRLCDPTPATLHMQRLAPASNTLVRGVQDTTPSPPTPTAAPPIPLPSGIALGWNGTTRLRRCSRVCSCCPQGSSAPCFSDSSLTLSTEASVAQLHLQITRQRFDKPLLIEFNPDGQGVALRLLGPPQIFRSVLRPGYTLAIHPRRR